MGQYLVLQCSDVSLSFISHTDTSTTDLETVLSQNFQGTELLILYLSRKLQQCETKYSTTERECLAIHWALVMLCYYLLGAPFGLLTDHTFLKWTQEIKVTNLRITRGIWHFNRTPLNDGITQESNMRSQTSFPKQEGILPLGRAPNPYCGGNCVLLRALQTYYTQPQEAAS